MSINLPHWLADVVNILGFNWPEIDEDQLREAAKGLRSYAHESQASHDTTHKIVTSDLQQVYSAQSYTALAEVWGSETSGHMQTLISVCNDLADALDLAAVGVEAMKDECIVQLGVAAGELVGDTVAAVFTFGLSEGAAVVEIEVQNRLLDGILERFEQTVVSELVNKTMGPLKEKMDQAVEKLLFTEVASSVVGGPPPGVTLDTAAMRTHGDSILREADSSLTNGRAFNTKMSALSFTTG
jgi:hypothetical protein